MNVGPLNEPTIEEIENYKPPPPDPNITPVAIGASGLPIIGIGDAFIRFLHWLNEMLGTGEKPKSKTNRNGQEMMTMADLFEDECHRSFYVSGEGGGIDINQDLDITVVSTDGTSIDLKINCGTAEYMLEQLEDMIQKNRPMETELSKK